MKEPDSLLLTKIKLSTELLYLKSVQKLYFTCTHMAERSSDSRAIGRKSHSQ